MPHPPTSPPHATDTGPDDTAAMQTRLRAFASAEEIAFPPAEHIDHQGERQRGWDGPYIAGTYLPVGIVGRNLADDWGGCQPFYPGVSEAQRIAARDYYLAHAALFQAQRWRAVQFDQRYRPGGDGGRLKEDIAHLLAELASSAARAEAAEAALLTAKASAIHYRNGLIRVNNPPEGGECPECGGKVVGVYDTWHEVWEADMEHDPDCYHQIVHSTLGQMWTEESLVEARRELAAAGFLAGAVAAPGGSARGEGA